MTGGKERLRLFAYADGFPASGVLAFFLGLRLLGGGAVRGLDRLDGVQRWCAPGLPRRLSVASCTSTRTRPRDAPAIFSREAFRRLVLARQQERCTGGLPGPSAQRRLGSRSSVDTHIPRTSPHDTKPEAPARHSRSCSLSRNASWCSATSVRVEGPVTRMATLPGSRCSRSQLRAKSRPVLASPRRLSTGCTP